MTQRTKKLRIPIAVDEKGNCYATGWRHEGTEVHGEDFEGMAEQARDLHRTSFPESQTVVTAWATIWVPLPSDEVEVLEDFTAE